MNRQPESNILLLGIPFLVLLCLIATAGCQSKTTLRKKQMAAFQAGRQEAIRQMTEARRTSIRILGNVQNPEIQWRDDLSLAQVIIEARCLDRKDPGLIVIYRQRVRIPIVPELLLRGDDVPLEPGDTIELQP